MSNLRKCLADAAMAIPLENLKVDDKLTYVEEPVAIVDRKVRKLRTKEISLVKVQWRYYRGQEVTWEVKADMKSKFPNLFDNRIPGTEFF